MQTAKRREFLKQLGVASVATGELSWGTEACGDGRAARIRIGQIGTAHAHAQGKMTTLRRFRDQYEVVGVVEPDEQLRDRVRNRPAYRGLKWMSEEELLNTKELQAVAVETAVRDLVPTASRCIAAGMHLHLDKPAGESLKAFRGLLSEAARRQLAVQMGYMFRYNPGFQFLFRAVRGGWLGALFEAHGVMSKTVDSDTRNRLAEYPGGSMFELGCHLIDALLVVFGEPDRITPYVRRTRPDQDSLADNQLAVFEFAKATATIRSSLIEVEGQRRRQFVVCGDRGTVAILPLEPPQATLTLAAARGSFRRGTQQVDLATPSGRYDGDFLDLARIIRGEKAPDYPPSHDLAVHEAVLRASGVPLG